MRQQDLLGYLSLVIAFMFYSYESPETVSKIGVFFNSMALGFFLSSMIIQLKERFNR